MKSSSSALLPSSPHLLQSIHKTSRNDLQFPTPIKKNSKSFAIVDRVIITWHKTGTEARLHSNFHLTPRRPAQYIICSIKLWFLWISVPPHCPLSPFHLNLYDFQLDTSFITSLKKKRTTLFKQKPLFYIDSSGTLFTSFWPVIVFDFSISVFSRFSICCY